MTNHQTLQLNADYMPIKVIPWQRAISLWFSDKVEIIEEYDTDISSVSLTMKCPAVVRLLKYRKYVKKQKVKFSRFNVFYRDGFECQYCGEKGTLTGLTFDHVIPRSHGGITSWTNIVTACHPCNSTKGNKLLHEMGWRLNSKPIEPNSNEFIRLNFTTPNTPEVWKKFIY